MSDTPDLFAAARGAEGAAASGGARTEADAARSPTVSRPRGPDSYPSAPLAVRMRPRTLDEVRGQQDALRPGLGWRLPVRPDRQHIAQAVGADRGAQV